MPCSCSLRNGGSGALCSLNHATPRSVLGWISFPAFVGRKWPYVQQAGVLPSLLEAPVEFLMCRDRELINNGPAWGLDEGCGLPRTDCFAYDYFHTFPIKTAVLSTWAPLPALGTKGGWDGCGDTLLWQICGDVQPCRCSLARKEWGGSFDRFRL